MPKLIFAGNDQELAREISFLLKGSKQAWSVAVISSLEALQQALSEAPEAVVVDAGNPFDPQAATAEIVRIAPDTLRLVLVSPREAALSLQSLSQADYVLAKPCNYRELLLTVDRALALREKLCSPLLSATVGRLKRLPSFPRCYAELSGLLSREDISINRLSLIIEQDPGLVAKILQVANSPFFAFQRSISNVQMALGLLGTETIRTLVLAHDVFSTYKHSTIAKFGADQLLYHSLAVGQIAKDLSVELALNKRSADEAFAAGVLHDIGKLILMNELPDLYKKSLLLEKELGSKVAAERQVFAANHAEVGAFVLDLWNLPESIVAAVAFHHEPEACAGYNTSAVSTVYIANQLANAVQNNRTTGENLTQLARFLQRIAPATGEDILNRCLTKAMSSGKSGRALLNKDAPHPPGEARS